MVLIALFCASLRRDLVSLLRFPFLSRVQVLSREIWLVCCLKYPCSCFSSHLCFLVIVLLILVLLFFFGGGGCGYCNSFFALFYVVFESLYRCINTVLIVGESTSTFVS